MNVDATEKAWWEAQVWYTWRAGVKPGTSLQIFLNYEYSL
jgi:hypothetical protein